MDNRIIENALRDAQDILWNNLPPTRNLSDEAAVSAVRDIVRSPAIKSVLERGSDTAFSFVLRAVHAVLADGLQTDRDTIRRLWPILDHPEVNRALGVNTDSPVHTRRKKPPAR